MKRTLLLLAILLCFFSTYAQTFGTTNTTVTSPGTVTITASGESNNTTNGKYFNAEQSQSILTVTPTANTSNVSLVFQSHSYYNENGQHPTSLVYVLTSTATVAVSVKIRISVAGYDANLQHTTAPQDFDFTITVNPAPTGVWNTQRTGPWYKQGCGAGFTAGTVSYTVLAHQYSASTLSAANALADAAGQAYINAHASCLIGNQATSGSFYSHTCATGTYAATPVVYPVPANTFYASNQGDANALAALDITNNGQAYADNYGPSACTALPAPIIQTATASGTTINLTLTNTTAPLPVNAVQVNTVDNTTGQVFNSTNGPNSVASISGLTQGRAYTVTVTVFGTGYPGGSLTSAAKVVQLAGTPPPPTTYYNTPQSVVFIKNNCGANFQGSSVTFTVQANTAAYNSLISIADANSKALAYINGGAGQTNANNNGSCITLSGVPTFTAVYGGFGGVVNFSVTPNIPNANTSVLHWADTTNGQSGSSAGSPTGFSSTFTSGHVYQFYFVCYGSGTPSSATSATQTFTMP